MCHGRRLGSLIFVLTLSACGAAHSGWKSFPVPIYADSTLLNSTQSMGDLKDAFSFWEQKAGKKIFDLKGLWQGGTPYSGDPTKPSEILGNVIFFANPWPYASSFVGMTTVQNSTDGTLAAMVMINGTTSFCTGDCNYDYRVSSRKTFAHELGHFIGLNHTANTADIMYPDAQPGGQISHLDVDITALKNLVSGQ
jgi:hypothetical protein